MQERRDETICRTSLFWGVALAALALSASAQVPPDDPSTIEQKVRYTVEIIVFVYADASSAGNEVFAPPAPIEDMAAEPDTGREEAPVYDDRGTSPRQAAAEPVEDSVVNPGADPSGHPPDGPLEEIPARARIELERLDPRTDPRAHRLQDTWRRLEQLDAYRPILHAAWTQTTHEKSASPELPLRTVSDPPLGLDGSINLYQSRFLHLDVDLTLDASGYGDGDARRSATDRLVRGEQREDSGEGYYGSDEPGGLQSPPLRYRITEDRIMRGGEVRYFDHPRFGMLATVRRVEDEPPADAPANAL